MGPQAMRAGPPVTAQLFRLATAAHSSRAGRWPPSVPLFIHSLEPASGSRSQISLNVDAKRNEVMIRCLLHGPFPLSSMMSC